MHQFSGFKIIDRIHSGQRSVVYRAKRLVDDHNVILKTVAGDVMPGVLARYRYAHSIATALEHQGINPVLDVLVEKRRPVLVSEDRGGESLHLLTRDKKFTTEEVIDIALDVGAALAHMHGKGVVHMDIKPANLVRVPDTGRAQIIDFDLSSKLQRSTQQSRNLDRLLGTLPYMSPEQTGRMNRPIDHRADLYSFGATLYELLTGAPPFEAEDAMGLVHCHIARLPVPVSSRAPGVPDGLSRIIMKLLEKAPEDRYQSAFGLVADLSRCKEMLRTKGEIVPFSLAKKDVRARFSQPDRLYGRDNELALLLRAFDDASDGDAGLLLVAGYAGVGKSSLVNELQKPVVARRGHFAAGKYNQLQNTPYRALSQALRELCADILAKPSEDVARWRDRIVAAVGGHGALLAELIPNIELIIGAQPPVMPLPPAEAENRFHLVFQRFLDAMASREHPLALFLDDVQWADAASLKLLRMLLASPETRHVLVVAAYRDNEVTEGHALRDALEKMEQAGVPTRTISVAPLDRTTIGWLIADTVGTQVADAAELADCVAAKTGGNPYFVREFLAALHTRDLVHYDEAAGCWAWDIDAIRKLDVTDNVVDLTAGSLRSLPAATRDVLTRGACIGNRFSLGHLATVLQSPYPELAEALWPAIERGVLLPMGDDYRYIGLEEGNTEASAAVEFRFVHDRVQEAALGLMAGEERAGVHLRIGQLWRAKRDAAALGDDLFDVVQQLNLGRTLLQTDSERRDLADLNVAAGKAAMGASAYTSARTFLDTARELLGDDCWTTARDAAWLSHRFGGEALQMVGEFAAADALFELCLQHAADAAAATEIRGLRMTARTRGNDYAGAISEGLIGLAAFGAVDHGDDMAAWQAATGAEAMVIAGLLENIDIESLATAAQMTDPDAKLETALLMSLAGPIYTQPVKFAWVVMRLVRLALEKGNSFESIPAYCFYGLLVTSMGDPVTGAKFTDLAMSMSGGLGVAALHGPNSFLQGAFIGPWTKPFADTRPVLDDAYSLLLEAGNFDYAGWCGLQIGMHSLLSGCPLHEVLATVDKFIGIFSSSLPYKDMVHMITGQKHAILRLMGDRRGRRLLDEKGLTEERVVELLGHYDAGLTLYILRAASHCILGEYRAAQNDIDAALPLVVQLGGHMLTVEYGLYRGLNAAALARTTEGEERAAHLATLAEVTATMTGWAVNGPENMGWKAALLSAEGASLAGEDKDACDGYDEAIDSALSNGFLQGEAIASERAADHHGRQKRARISRHYRRDAFAAYMRWGASAKARHIERRFPGVHTLLDTSMTLSTSSTVAGGLDALSLVKATQALSGELNVGALLERIMATVIENGGAERGALVLVNNGELRLQAVINDPNDEADVLLDLPLEQATGIALSVVRYVERTRESVVLGDAGKSARHGKDPHIEATGALSLLCTPILNQGVLTGVLYLENNLTAHAFTPARCTILEALAAQAAISVENARLYAEQLQLKNSFRRFVPTEFLEQLDKRSILEVGLGDAVAHDMAVLFLDIRNFTALSESMSPKGIFDHLNGYLGHVGPAIRAHGGFIDKYIGDAVMALFPDRKGVPLRAAVAIQREVEAFNAEIVPQGLPPMVVGIGVHRGALMLGTIGEPERLDNTVISDAVNVASRLEGMTKHFGVTAIASRDAIEASGQGAVAHRWLGKVVLKGKREPIDVHELIDADEPEVMAAKAGSRALFERAVAAYTAGELTAAREGFEQVLADHEADTVARYFIALIDGGSVGGALRMGQK